MNDAKENPTEFVAYLTYIRDEIRVPVRNGVTE